jgi:hypothetical protein
VNRNGKKEEGKGRSMRRDKGGGNIGGKGGRECMV